MVDPIWINKIFKFYDFLVMKIGYFRGILRLGSLTLAILVLLIYGFIWEKNVDFRITKIIDSIRTNHEANFQTKSFKLFEQFKSKEFKSEELKSEVENASWSCSFGLGRLGNQVKTGIFRVHK